MSDFKPSIPDRPEGWQSDAIYYNMTDATGIQRGTMGNKNLDYAKSWDKVRAMWKRNAEHIESIGGNGMRLDSKRHDAIIDKEQWEGV